VNSILNNMKRTHRALFISGIGTLVATMALTWALTWTLTCSADGVLDLGNVMPLGDSITNGFGDLAGGGYRDPLYTSLTGAGHTLQYVGTRNTLPTPLLTSNGQASHNGGPGFVIETGSSGKRGIRDNIASYLSRGNPDIILLMVGTNDMRLNYEVATAPNRLSDLLTDIATLQPNAYTIVANLVPIKDASEQPLFDDVAAYNAAIPGVVATHQGLGHRVSFLDMNSFLTAPDDMFDRLHPNAGGYDKMAVAWEEAIHAIPEPSVITLATLGLLSLLSRRRRAVEPLWL